MSLMGGFIKLVRPVIEKFPRVAMIYRGLRDQFDILEEPQKSIWGFWMSGNKSMADGSFEPSETKLILELLEDADIFINVGANVGYYCCHALQKGKSVIAFEPLPRNLQHLCRNIKINGWRNVEIYPMALSDRLGVIEIFGSNTGASTVKGWAGISDSFFTLSPVSTLGTVLNNRLSGKQLLVLVDVEGAEFAMLQGATGILEMDPKPVWMIEITTTDNQPKHAGFNPKFKDTFDMFFQRGYQAFTVGENINPITEADVQSVVKGELRLDTHNFLFRQKH